MRKVPFQKEQRYQSNIEAAFHIEQMSQNWYKDPADRVKKLSGQRV
jgi:rubrerythrin